MRLLNEALLHLMTWEPPEIRIPRVSEEKGQTLAEYGLIMAVIAVAVVVTAVVAFRGAITAAFDGAVDCLDGVCS